MILFTCLISLKWVSGRGVLWEGGRVRVIGGEHRVRGIVQVRVEKTGGAVLTGGKKHSSD